MATATELLAPSTRPLSATLLARPARVCVLVPDFRDVPWQLSVEQALAAQVAVWGGSTNVVAPFFEETVQDDLFWSLLDRFDPDLIGVYAPRWNDLLRIAPKLHEAWTRQVEGELRELDFEDEAIADHMARQADQHVWLPWTPDEDVMRLLIDRLSPVHFDDQLHFAFVDGTTPPDRQVTNVFSLSNLPDSVVDITAETSAIDQLHLTHAVGRLLPWARKELDERGVQVKEVPVQHRQFLRHHVWAGNRTVVDYRYPWALSAGGGLAQRLYTGDRGLVIIVVGSSRRDFFLMHALSRMRPYVFWLPQEHVEDDELIAQLADAARRTAQEAIGAGNLIAVTAADDFNLAERAADRLNQVDAGPAAIEPRSWKTLVPTGSMYAVDARSERRAALLRYDDETPELPTPAPVATEAPDFLDLRWVVDVEVEGWSPIRHPAAAAASLSGTLLDTHQSRVSAVGLTYPGPAAFIQRVRGPEGSTTTPRLVVRTLHAQLAELLEAKGWRVEPSDKGIYTSQSASLFGGVEELAQALREPHTRALLDAYVHNSRTNDPGIFLKDTERRYLSTKEAANVVPDDRADEVITDLYDRGVLQRGHALKCPICRATSFYSLTEAQEFTCRRCSTRHRATRDNWLGTTEPEFRYSLAEVVFQFLTHNNQLPLLAAHEQFVVGRKREGRKAFDCAFEIELTPPTGNKRETDIVVSWGSELWLGEATRSNTLGGRNEERSRIRRLALVANELRARGVLFVTEAAAFSERTTGAITDTFNDPTWPKVILVEGFSTAARLPAEEAAE